MNYCKSLIFIQIFKITTPILLILLFGFHLVFVLEFKKSLLNFCEISIIITYFLTVFF